MSSDASGLVSQNGKSSELELGLKVPISRYRAYLLFGAPGSGKGTQGSVLGKIPGFIHISTGELFRNLQINSPLAKIFIEYSSKGQLVPNEFTIDLWRDYVGSLVTSHRYDPEHDTLLLDGIPRTTGQAEIMESYIDVKRVYYLDCKDKRVMYTRLQRRALIENRLDDANVDVINSRLKVYEAQTFPVLQHYPSSLIKQIDTSRSPVQVLADIVDDMALVEHSVAEETKRELAAAS